MIENSIIQQTGRGKDMSNEKAKELLERAKKIIPRASQTMSKAYTMWAMDDVFPIFAESQKGCIVTSIDGNKFIDMVGGLGTNFLPSNNKFVKKAINDQLKKGINFSLPTALETELAELLHEIIPSAEQVRFCKNGSDAVSAAIRLARSYSKKDDILSISGGYNGWSDSVAAASARAYGIPKILGDLVTKVQYNDLISMEEQLKTEKFACVLMEPVSLEEPRSGYLDGVRLLCDKYNTILIFDEVLSGGRWALGGAQAFYNVVPDITTVGKFFGFGMPISAIVGKQKYMEEFNHIFFSATYFGECISLASSIATLKEIKKNEKQIYSHIWTQGNRIKDNFDKTCKKLGIDGKAIGMAPRLNFKFNYENENALKDLFHQQMIHRGILFGVQTLITPAVTKGHINKVIRATNESLKVIQDILTFKQDVDYYLKGQRSVAIFKREADNK